MLVFHPSLRLLEEIALSFFSHLAIRQGEILEFARVGFSLKKSLTFWSPEEFQH